MTGSAPSRASAGRLILICHASTAAMRGACFPADEPLDAPGKAGAVAMSGRVPRAGRSLTSPELRTRQTAEALGLDAAVEPTLRDCDYGAWTGRSFADVHAREPDAVADWLRNAAATPHRGESLDSLMQRVDAWLLREQARARRSIVVTHASIIRAAIVHAIGAPPQSFWRIDIAPLSITRLSRNGNRWNLASSGCAVPSAE